MKIAIVGTGYVGLVSGTCFAELGNEVICVDIDAKKVARMKRGEVPIYEPQLEELFSRNLEQGRLTFTTKLADAAEAGIIFLALPTPPDKDGSADLSYVLTAADELGPLINHYTVIVNKSTVPVGTAELVRERIAAKATAPFDVVSNPEFLREGYAVGDFMQPDRIVIGSSSRKAQRLMDELYAPLARQDYVMLYVDERSAEMIKYAANSFLATKITFINSIANLCERFGADIEAVRLGMGSDHRIGQQFLFPGIGYGGSCFPKDVQALAHAARSAGLEFELLEAVMAGNARQHHVLTDKVRRYFGNLRGKTFALWGLAFKPDTDDIREAPSLQIIETLLEAGAQVQAYDPEAMPNVKKRFGDRPGLTFARDRYAALKDADALLIATEWPQFQAVSLPRVKRSLRNPVIFDGRNTFGPDILEEAGFYYECIGRPVVNALP